jgi:hypothetical protein
VTREARIRVRALFAALSICIPMLAAAAADSDFLSGFGDLPLMKGLAAVADSETVFDTPDGRIVEAYAAGRVSRERVESFYRKSLPQLGWRREKRNVYRREEERLTIEFKTRGETLTVRFMLAPAGARK